jgi:hypothetical protein
VGLPAVLSVTAFCCFLRELSPFRVRTATDFLDGLVGFALRTGVAIRDSGTPRLAFDVPPTIACAISSDPAATSTKLIAISGQNRN